MKEIKVGEYVRTDIGNIFQYEGKTKKIIDEYISVSDNQNIEFLGKIEKHSKNIIDLIEVGDYINGELVTGFGYEDVNGAKEKSILVEGKYTKVSFALLELDIKTILTKEQFEQNCYKIEQF